eukprot:m.195613 g.195613  ORF g.195613 m.195613 type:complete len:104 (-) comp19553_c0_seq1:109-420(-)
MVTMMCLRPRQLGMYVLPWLKSARPPMRGACVRSGHPRGFNVCVVSCRVLSTPCENLLVLLDQDKVNSSLFCVLWSHVVDTTVALSDGRRSHYAAHHRTNHKR